MAVYLDLPASVRGAGGQQAVVGYRVRHDGPIPVPQFRLLDGTARVIGSRVTQGGPTETTGTLWFSLPTARVPTTQPLVVELSLPGGAVRSQLAAQLVPPCVRWEVKPRLTIGPNGPGLELSLVNCSPFELSLTVDLRFQGGQLHVSNPGLNLGVGHDPVSMTLDVSGLPPGGSPPGLEVGLTDPSGHVVLSHPVTPPGGGGSGSNGQGLSGGAKAAMAVAAVGGAVAVGVVVLNDPTNELDWAGEYALAPDTVLDIGIPLEGPTMNAVVTPDGACGEEELTCPYTVELRDGRAGTVVIPAELPKDGPVAAGTFAGTSTGSYLPDEYRVAVCYDPTDEAQTVLGEYLRRAGAEGGLQLLVASVDGRPELTVEETVPSERIMFDGGEPPGNCPPTSDTSTFSWRGVER
jgi:hypothetical protein